MDHRTTSKMRHDILLRIIKIISVLLSVCAFGGCWYGYYSGVITSPFYAKGNYVVIALYAIILLVFTRVYDALQISYTGKGQIVYSQFLALGFSDAIIYIVICLLSKGFPSLIPGLICFVIQFFLSILWALFAQKMYFTLFKPSKTLIIYDQRNGLEHTIERYELESKYDIVKVIDINECLADLSALNGIEVVFLSGIHSHERNIILKKCIADDIRVFVIPRVGDVIMSGAHKMHMMHLPMLRVERYRPAIEFQFVKRMMDIIISFVAIIILSPALLISAILIKAYDKGPVFYKQNRLTKDGKIFKIIKLRTMRVDAEKDGVARLSSGDKDDRITPVGRFLRKVRADEIPQLFNILGGSMSLIGPRPERPEIAEQYEKEMPEFRLRLQAKAGLTGYAQVYGKYNTTPYDKLQMDLMYIANPSLLEEASIMFATIKILFMPDSTEGIAEGQTTALASQKDKDALKKTS